MQDNNITDVEFKEVPTETAAATTSEFFLPANYLINALTAAGHPNPTAWALHIDPRVETAEEEKDRIFFANRALRIYLSEQEAADTISVRMLLAEGIPAAKWCALVDKGIVPWLMGQFDEKGQRIDQQKVEEVLAEEGVEAAPTDVETQESFQSTTEPSNLADKINAMAPAARTATFVLPEGQAPVIGVDEAAPGSMDSLPGSITE